MQNENNFTKKVTELNEQVKSYYKTFESDDCQIISDGIVNCNFYYNSQIKILWILKEPYDIDNDGAGGWSITEKLNCSIEDYKELGGLKSTWYPIAYINYSIANNFLSFDEMDNIVNKPEMLNSLKNMAFINIQKFAAGTTTNMIDIKNAYNQHKHILLKQIETYNPDVLIFAGNTISLFETDLCLIESKSGYDEYNYWVKNKQLFINANHPAYPKKEEDKENYVDDIVRIVKNNLT